MEITVYNGERFERSAWWYILAWTIFATVIMLSLFTSNIAWVVLLFLFLGGYLYYGFVDTNRLVKVSMQENGLSINKKLYARSEVQFFCLEVDMRTQKLHNIIFQFRWYHAIHTFADEQDKVKEFVKQLQASLPLVETIQQTFLERLTRRLKL